MVIYVFFILFIKALIGILESAISRAPEQRPATIRAKL